MVQLYSLIGMEFILAFHSKPIVELISQKWGSHPAPTELITTRSYQGLYPAIFNSSQKGPVGISPSVVPNYGVALLYPAGPPRKPTWSLSIATSAGNVSRWPPGLPFRSTWTCFPDELAGFEMTCMDGVSGEATWTEVPRLIMLRSTIELVLHQSVWSPICPTINPGYLVASAFHLDILFIIGTCSLRCSWNLSFLLITFEIINEI